VPEAAELRRVQARLDGSFAEGDGIDVTAIATYAHEGGGIGGHAVYIQRMTMKNFLVAAAITAVFLGILLLAGTMQNEGCLPWKTPVTVGGNGPFSDNRGTKLCR
jgi:hypothetical protein